ncbi:RNA Pol II transcript 3' end formation complex subunit, putative [Candida dubliniensis CD36]|uniref:RNA Pol II transcript 3' end formation complex subunit, putative n=1 Tax=Candida dubliniensis (strain CD36 / ATCC MYA-646 / CBS 7987 / NCPF 3949 / NRRL Y-17841) TaxID=573826 RepID=B9WMR3_CANDC|nr:RNA Pol II transcript 3' end formation complex subunit, putative [Candida dubliniensis CD36]CAX40379.1 RNA Pol II transcript 3' end formation complex subunit, putative [Candida dubliniensis CD36]
MPPSLNSNILYIGNLPFDWDERTVESVVFGSGNIVDVRLGFDRVGKNKGFCFVEYKTVQDAQKALPLLQQVVIYQNGRNKKLRVELSKEGYKAQTINPDSRPIKQLNRSKLPVNVKLPNEMIANSPHVMQAPVLPSNGLRGGSMQPPPLAPPMAGGPNQQVPSKLLQASKFLPPASNFRLETTDNINVSLSKIPPPSLIELISQMKALSQRDPTTLRDFFQNQPEVALCTAQALLLMGFIDSDVIEESSRSASSTPQLQTLQPGNQSTSYMGGQTGGYNNSFNRNNGQNFQQQQQQQIIPGSKWPHLPLQIQQKLVNMPPDQAHLAAQILSLSPESLSGLSPQERQTVDKIRAQYLS